MSKEPRDSLGAASASSNGEDDLGAFLLSRIALQRQELDVDKIFRALVKLEGSDLHLQVGSPPMVRTKGELRPLNRSPIDAEEMVRLIVPLLDERNRGIFRKEGGVDFAHSCDVDGTKWRFRVNVLTRLGHIGMVARRINNWIPDFEGLHLPPSVERLCRFDQGLVLLAGVTGSGKSTTIAAMLNYINPKAKKPDQVAILTREGCGFCAKAKALLKGLGYQYSEVKLDHSDRSRVVGAITGRGTVPQVFINGRHVGGLEELQEWAKKAA